MAAATLEAQWFQELHDGRAVRQVEIDVGRGVRNTAATFAEPAFSSSPEATALLARGHRFTSTAEIGAATGIEFLPGGGVLAAAEPVRRGGGSAMVESPSP